MEDLPDCCLVHNFNFLDERGSRYHSDCHRERPATNESVLFPLRITPMLGDLNFLDDSESPEVCQVPR